MKRWKITGPKQEPVTCENCEEGREIICVYRKCTEKKVRYRRGMSLCSSGDISTGDANQYTFIRYLDPDPETPKQVRFADVAVGVVFRTDMEHLVFWKTKTAVWFTVTTVGEVGIWDLDRFKLDELVTLTGQTAELVEEE